MKRFLTSYLPVLALLITLTACGGESGSDSSTSMPKPENMAQAIDQHIKNDNYPAALELLNEADPNKVANLEMLKEKVHLNYGLFLEYRGENQSMRDRMTGALRQYVKTLQINANNEKARSEIKQIMGIYQTMPGKTVPEDIINNLQELGFNYGN
jgi:hypothetical protein